MDEVVEVSAWAEAVRAGILASDGRTSYSQLTLLAVEISVGGAGAEYVDVMYQYPRWPKNIGYRELLEADDIARYAREPDPRDVQLQVGNSIDGILDVIGEPLGRTSDLLVPDGRGTHWWGHGFRGIDSHPDFHRDACASCGLTPRPSGPCPRCGVSFTWVDGELDLDYSPPTSVSTTEWRFAGNGRLEIDRGWKTDSQRD